MLLRAGIAALALKLQESSDDGLSNGDVCTRLRDALSDSCRGTGSWCYYIDHFGDSESGDVIYSKDGDTFRAPYEISGGEAAAKCAIDFDNAEDVVPRTIYEVEQDEDGHYAAMSESLKTEELYTDLPIYERFVSKAERDAAGHEDFAGKGKSFPILKAEDVSAAAHALGRAGSKNNSIGAIKARIIAIAKRKGWTSKLPKAWQDGGGKSKESAVIGNATGLKLIESATTLETIVLREAKADYSIKLIAPGKGSSAFYPAEVLKRDGPKVFKSGTHVYLNHPTAAEESARPEGDVSNLAGVLTSTAEYQEAGSKGPGLYARMKVFADHAQTVEEKAPHVGMSIRASGVAESGVMREGVPVLKELTGAESVDVVTRAGAGGMILQESAAAQSDTGVDMDEAKIKELIEAATLPLKERALRGDAVVLAARILRNISFSETQKQFVTDTILKESLPIKDGALDEEKFAEAVIAEAKRYAATISGGARVVGMGLSEAPKKKAKAKKDEEDEDEPDTEAKEAAGAVKVFESLGMNKAQAEAAAKGRVA